MNYYRIFLWTIHIYCFVLWAINLYYGGDINDPMFGLLISLLFIKRDEDKKEKTDD